MPERIAVLGAGTMGAGIAQLALAKGFRVALYDVAAPGLARGRGLVEAGLARLVEKGTLPAEAQEAALAGFTTTSAIDDLVEFDLAVEAAPESLSLKQDLFRHLEARCRPEAILASNTSSLSITAIASACRRPDRVVGLHFFNPAPLMRLVEVVAGQASSEAALSRAEAFAERLGKTPVRCQDTPGFVVNRVARAFYGEPLRMLAEGGDVAVLDAVMRDVGGFKMGPFELMDLIGIDVNLAVTTSVYEAFYHEPRFRPHPIQARMAAAGHLGRKTGRGFYEHG